MEESLEFLSKVFDLLVDGDVFDTRSNEPKAIVDFHHPKELEVGFGGKVLIEDKGEEEALSRDEGKKRKSSASGLEKLTRNLKSL
jgi:hypothetical protein